VAADFEGIHFAKRTTIRAFKMSRTRAAIVFCVRGWIYVSLLMLLRCQSAEGISSVCRDEDNRRGVTKAFVRGRIQKVFEAKQVVEGRKTLVTVMWLGTRILFSFRPVMLQT
jgi:hypothetical protein